MNKKRIEHSTWFQIQLVDSVSPLSLWERRTRSASESNEVGALVRAFIARQSFFALTVSKWTLTDLLLAIGDELRGALPEFELVAHFLHGCSEGFYFLL